MLVAIAYRNNSLALIMHVILNDSAYHLSISHVLSLRKPGKSATDAKRLRFTLTRTLNLATRMRSPPSHRRRQSHMYIYYIHTHTHTHTHTIYRTLHKITANYKKKKHHRQAIYISVVTLIYIACCSL